MLRTSLYHVLWNVLFYIFFFEFDVYSIVFQKVSKKYVLVLAAKNIILDTNGSCFHCSLNDIHHILVLRRLKF